jgi:nucleotide-binding universal stress UspA family protein
MYTKILVAIDGSSGSLTAGKIALELAGKTGATLVAANVFDAQIHTQRFHEMESILPGQYREEDTEEQLREVHNVWTNEGFLALSKKRLAPYLEMCKQAGFEGVEEVNRQGRNYVEIINAAEEVRADLIVMGASGIGSTAGELGSTASRVLRMASCDVLLARREIANGQIIVGIDGSDEATQALGRAEVWSEAFDAELVLGAVYDPVFHNKVLESLEDASSTYETSYHGEIYKAVDEHGDSASYGSHGTTAAGVEDDSESHDQMVDEGLARLYGNFLESAVEKSSTKPATELLKGKPYQQLASFANQSDASLIAVGRNGLHKTEVSTIGSNAEGLTRLSETNVLVIGS